MDVTKHILHEIESINYYAKEYLKGGELVGYEDFIEHYQDYRLMLTQQSLTDTKTKLLIDSLPLLKSDRTFWPITASIVALLLVILIWIYVYFFVTLLLGVLLFLSVRHWVLANRKTKVTQIIDINDELHNLLIIEAQGSITE